MTIQFHPTNEHRGQNVTFTKSDIDPKFIRISGILKDLLLPHGIYFQMVDSISYNRCSIGFCFNYKLKDIMALYAEEKIEDERSKIGYQEISDEDINWSELPG
jgi:hypothetical protein